MVWRGSADIKDRIFGSLVYLMPLYSVMPFGGDLFRQFPFLEIITIPLIPLSIIYSIPFGSLIVFFVLFLAVVRNEKIAHFIRFNTMQAILIDIVLSLLSFLFFRIIGPGILNSLIETTIHNVIFTGILAVIIYAISQCVVGRYPEIPAISEAVYTQVP